MHKEKEIIKMSEDLLAVSHLRSPRKCICSTNVHVQSVYNYFSSCIRISKHTRGDMPDTNDVQLVRLFCVPMITKLQNHWPIHLTLRVRAANNNKLFAASAAPYRFNVLYSTHSVGVKWMDGGRPNKTITFRE